MAKAKIVARVYRAANEEEERRQAEQFFNGVKTAVERYRKTFDETNAADPAANGDKDSDDPFAQGAAFCRDALTNALDGILLSATALTTADDDDDNIFDATPAVEIALKFPPEHVSDGAADASFVCRRLIADPRLTQIVTTEEDDGARVALYFESKTTPDETVDFVQDAVCRLRVGANCSRYEVNGDVVLKGGPGGVFEYVADKRRDEADDETEGGVEELEAVIEE